MGKARPGATQLLDRGCTDRKCLHLHLCHGVLSNGVDAAVTTTARKPGIGEA